MGEVAVIELGEVPPDLDVDEAPARPWPHRRWALAALALGLAVVTVGGSIPPPQRLPMAVLGVPTASAVVGADGTIFVAEADRMGIHRHIVAYALTDLRELWRVEPPDSGVAYRLMAVDDTLVMTLAEPGVGLSTLGIDATTGAVRWRHQDSLNAPTRGGLVLLSSERPDSGVAPGDGEASGVAQTLRAVRADTGALAWSLDLPAGATWSYRFDGDNVDLLAVVPRPGWAEIRDVDTGKVLRSQHIEAPATMPGGGRFAEIIGDLLLVREASSTVAYGLNRLDRRWRLPFEAGYEGLPIECGTAICFISAGLTVVDPITGRRKWSDDRLTTVMAQVGGYLIASGTPPDDQMMVAVDAETGHVRRELGSWQDVRPDSVPGSIIGVRYGTTRSLVARLDPARGTRILDVLHDIVVGSCWTQSSRLLCWRLDNTLGVWRLPD